MASGYRVEFYGLSEHDWPRVLDAVQKQVGIFGHQVRDENGRVVIAGNPNIPQPEQNGTKK
jgi:hypothetical protein